MPPSVEIACDVFEGNDTNATREYPEAGFNIHFHRDFADELQNPSVALYCAIGYVMRLAQNPDQLRALFDKAKYHCEGCVAEVTSTVRRRPAPRKRPT